MPCAVRSRRLATDVIGEVDYCGVDIDLDPYPPTTRYFRSYRFGTQDLSVPAAQQWQ